MASEFASKSAWEKCGQRPVPLRHQTSPPGSSAMSAASHQRLPLKGQERVGRPLWCPRRRSTIHSPRPQPASPCMRDLTGGAGGLLRSTNRCEQPGKRPRPENGPAGPKSSEISRRKDRRRERPKPPTNVSRRNGWREMSGRHVARAVPASHGFAKVRSARRCDAVKTGSAAGARAGHERQQGTLLERARARKKTRVKKASALENIL